MIIGICINQAWNIYNFRRGLIKAFIESGHQVVGIAPPDSIHEAKLKEIGCGFFPVPMEAKGSNPFSDLLLINTLRNAYQSAQLDVVLQFTIKPNIYGTLAAKSLGIVAINNVTGLGTVFIRQNFTAKIAHQLYKLAFRFPQCVFFQNEDDRKLFFEMKLVKASKARLLPGSGVNLQYFSPSAFKKEGTFTFLLMARVIYDKGILEYIEAARYLKKQGLNVACHLLGKIETDAGLGIGEAQVQEWVSQGVLSYFPQTSDVRPYIAQADCVVLPSYREGTPKTLLEAMAMAKPLIATDVPGCKETVIHEQNGYLCEVRNGLDLGRTMERMFNLDPEKRAEMGRNSRKYAEERFDEQVVIKAYLEEINKITTRV